MAYSYDRTASEKKWHDILGDAQQDFMDAVVKALAKELDGTAKHGGFASGSVDYAKGTVQLGFVGGSTGMVYVKPAKGKRYEESVVNHTPTTFASYMARKLG